jgi:hypothetical protein
MLSYPILASSFRVSGRNIVIIAYFLCVPNFIKVQFSLLYEAPESVKKKVKQSRYRSGVAQRVPGS